MLVTNKVFSPEGLFQEKISSPFWHPSKFAFANLLRNRLTLRRFADRRNLWTFGDHDILMIVCYSCQHSHFWVLQNFFQNSFFEQQNVPLPKTRSETSLCMSSLRYMTLAPNHLRRIKARPVIYYDFMIGWLLPSPPPGCLCLHTSFSTQSWFEDLIGRSGLFPFWLQTLSPEVCLERNSCVFGVSLESVRLWATLFQRVLYPPWTYSLRSTSIDFAENQLFPSLISLSPLGTSHPCILQHTWVRSSKMCYHIFNLLMPRSLGFGSHCINHPLWKVVFTSPPPHGLSLLIHCTRWPIMQKVHRHTEKKFFCASIVWSSVISGSFSLPSEGFFSPFPHGTCSLSVIEKYLGFESGLPIFQHNALYSGHREEQLIRSSSRWPAHSEAKLLNIQGFHLLEQEISLFFVVHEKSLPFPISLATTFGISVDVFSFSYLDVSVHWVFQLCGFPVWRSMDHKMFRFFP